VSEYTEHHYARGPGFCIDMSAPSFTLKDRGREWRTEWHYYHGPTRLNKRTDDPLQNQPGEWSRWWCVAQWWHDQGGKVVDGVGVWTEPEIVETKWLKVGRQMFPLDTKGAAGHGVIVTRRHWKGYEQFGDPSRYR
jgi:hypothetical protein